MMAITTIYSMSVKPATHSPGVLVPGIFFSADLFAPISLDRRFVLPIRIARPVQRSGLRLRINIEHVFPAPACRVRIVLDSSQPPFCLSGDGVHWHATQETNLGIIT